MQFSIATSNCGLPTATSLPGTILPPTFASMSIKPSLQLFALLTLTWLACSSTKDAGGDKDQFGGPGPGDSLFFHMERTPCFGRCPVYKLDVYRSGYATFDGSQNTPLIGQYRTWVSRDRMERLVREAES